MTKEQLYDKVIGDPNPLFLNKREKKIFADCLEIINDLEKQLQYLKEQSEDVKEFHMHPAVG